MWLNIAIIGHIGRSVKWPLVKKTIINSSVSFYSLS
jgi:hypothetical protein